MAGTALVYDEEMMSYSLLWDDPECAIEVPERLSSSYKRLQDYDLVNRCVRLPVREATEEEIMLVHSREYLDVVKSTQSMDLEELKETSKKYIAAYFHQNSYHCAKLSLGGTLQVVDAVMSGGAQNGMALIRPPGHHSQRSASNGFCVFNNVAVAAEYAKNKYKVQRILIVDWDIHHGQGIQYIFENDPSVLYFSWHRYEHGSFWPCLSESNFDFIGKGGGTGFNINLPWNQIGMGNADYIAAFLHVLLPVAFEFNPELVLVSAGYDSGIGDPEGCMRATPECFSHLTHMLMHLAGGKMCMILEGGYHLRSLSESVSMTVRTLLRDPVPRLSGEMIPCYSALESIQNARHVHSPYWKCFLHDETRLVEEISTKGLPTPAPLDADISDMDEFLENHMKKILHPTPPVTALLVAPVENTMNMPAGMQLEEDAASPEQAINTIRVFNQEQLNKNLLNSVVKMLPALEKLVNRKTRNCITLSPNASLSAAVAVQQVLHLGSERVLCIIIGDVDIGPAIGDDGKTVCLTISGDKMFEKSHSQYQTFFKWKENSHEGSSFFYALFRFLLPLVYSFQPDLIILAIGSNGSVDTKDIALLTSLLQGLAEGAVLAVVTEKEKEIIEALSNILVNCASMVFGPYKPPSKECVRSLTQELAVMQAKWRMLQCLAK
ncbi:polyamine deacetylase HDAC10 isoform X2 [Hyla sarda]|nr:polyamine deacetylase HDAC10 isoform X2 [Hyla sarda]XP_056429724.1 polyamine deacetylase HDAC10 isoform X2 [Hyla sarda]XP_056429725.1 polyamine deacetylase HDAC10 isoform X2 [Hyla sarda]XP_056429726.1 polyamine deacetylase HDAC10 isoform X2 [Hyla sarda]XP_056429727.1 polyamine deacetylase HDAC10 isoform X2 [Hyla sarda]